MQRKQRARATSADAHEDTASIMSGGAVTLASEGDYEVTALEERVRDSLRPIEEQLRVLTEEHRKGSIASIGQRLVQLEHEMQSRAGGNACQCTGRDPLWEIIVWLTCTTVVFVLLRWVEGRLWARTKNDAQAQANKRSHGR